MNSCIKKIAIYILSGKLSKLNRLYQFHQGQECYLFGDGISLKSMDLSKFNDKISILGNFSVYHKQVNQLNAPYCSIVEPFFFYPFFFYREKNKSKIYCHFLHLEYKKIIRKYKDKIFFINVSNYPSTFFLKNILYVQRYFVPPFKVKNPFDERSDAHEGTFKFQISLAIFLGFKKVYLVGHDYTHSPSRSLHFYEKGKGDINNIKAFNQEFINYAKKYIDIVTITLDSESEVLEYVKYKDYTNSEPVFKENTEIVEKESLECLATWHGYNIY